MGMDWAAPPTTRPAANRAGPPANGSRAPRRSAARPASTMPRRLPRKNPLNTQPYSPRPPRSSATTGITVAMANDSNATSVIVSTRATVRRRRAGAHTPSSTARSSGARWSRATSDMLACQHDAHPWDSLTETGAVDATLIRPRGEDALVRSLLTGIAVFRWLAWVWLVVVLALNRSQLSEPTARPGVALVLAGVALVVTAADTGLLSVNPSRLLAPAVVAAEVTVGFALAAADGLAYNGIAHPQTLSSAWPLAGVMSAGIALRWRGGVVAGAVIGLGTGLGELLEPGAWSGRDTISVVSNMVLYALAGLVAGFETTRLREAERRISLAQAREEVARTLRDGVLQTLAVVQRRTQSPDIVRLAHDQERELREFLYGTRGAVGGGGDLGTRLRAAAARYEDRYGGTARVVLAPDTPALAGRTVEALAGAVGEALANAGKHGGATSVTVYAEPLDGELFCSVKDDGAGFDPDAAEEGTGLRRSVRGRIAEVGGRVEIDGRPGRGTEVRCWVPL